MEFVSHGRVQTEIIMPSYSIERSISTKAEIPHAVKLQATRSVGLLVITGGGPEIDTKPDNLRATKDTLLTLYPPYDRNSGISLHLDQF